MTEPSSVAAPASTTPAAPQKASFWEDLIDIFFSPAAVFRRNESKSVWPPLLFVSLAIGVIFFVTFNQLEPIFDAEFNRNMQKAMAQNPQLTAEAVSKMKAGGEAVTRYGLTVIIFFTVLVVGVVSWVVGKLVGSAQSFQAALVVAAWAYMPRVVGAVLGGVQGLLMDPANLTSQMAISLSPARFFAPDQPSPIAYQFMGRLDLITIWVTILLAVGLYVTGKVSKGRATVFGVIMWLIGALPALRQAYMAM
jgi:Yip1-like protein